MFVSSLDNTLIYSRLAALHLDVGISVSIMAPLSSYMIALACVGPSSSMECLNTLLCPVVLEYLSLDASLLGTEKHKNSEGMFVRTPCNPKESSNLGYRTGKWLLSWRQT
jgi:hypothetical protein